VEDLSHNQNKSIKTPQYASAVRRPSFGPISTCKRG